MIKLAQIVVILGVGLSGCVSEVDTGGDIYSDDSGEGDADGPGTGDEGDGSDAGDEGDGSGAGDEGDGSGAGDEGDGSGAGDEGDGSGAGDEGDGSGAGDEGDGSGTGDDDQWPVLEGLNIDLNEPLNYANQPIPAYITQDNMPAGNRITDAGATLGRVLFYDPLLSSNNTVSCASCHQQALAFSDSAPLSQGVHGLSRRHSMRLVNIRFSEDTLFGWDRSATIEDRMIIPIRDAIEMGYSGADGQPSINDLIQELEATSYYPILFEFVYGDREVNEERIALAMAQFVRSIQSFDSRFDQGRAEVDSDLHDFANFTEEENAGKRLFIESFEYEVRDVDIVTVGGEVETFTAAARIDGNGGFNCGSCHRPPEFDIDPQSLNNGFIRNTDPNGTSPFDFSVTRSPTMRDLAQRIDQQAPSAGRLNGGMFHIGEAQNLFGIRAHYEFRQLDERNTNLDERMSPEGLPLFLNMTDAEAAQLNAFLLTLTGHAVYTDERWSNPFGTNS